jgi:proteasome lid subunit RPN8/RPN11
MTSSSESDEISFGDIQQIERQTQRRPDENKHFAVVPVFSPGEEDLRVYVDVDAMRDMELHAKSNTGVELGGVLLGGQFVDEDGRPFVIVTDSLRAQHYESTKGSFKFTHDTWSQITRERDEFPEELQMVGWYHTHPDWGVFLSGMDMFICDNFFNKPLDVALVIDPCRDDRGFFQWTNNPAQRTRRTNGFYLIGSRFRAQELEFYAAQLEGEATMAHDPRFGGHSGPYPAPVVNISDSRGAWQAPAIMAMLTVQFCFLALVAWKILAPLSDAESATARDKQLQAIEERLADIAAIRSEQARLDAQRAVLDQVLGEVNVAPQGLVTSLMEERQRVAELESSVLDKGSRVREAEAALRREQTTRKQDRADLQGRIARLESDNRRYLERNENLTALLSDTEKRLEKHEPKAKTEKENTAEGQTERNWKWYAAVGVAAALLLIVGGALIFTFGRRDDEEMFSEEKNPPPNNPSGGPGAT